METGKNEWMIEADGVGRTFDGSNALRDFTLRVPRGVIYGFLGRNGSGKTTAIKILAGLLRPGTGTARVLGKDPFTLTPEDRQRIGYVSEKQIFPLNMKVEKLAAFCAQFYPRWDHARVDRLIETFRLDRRKKMSALSQGGQRQVAFLLAVAQRPELLLLDEPASTLDVVARREFLDEILSLLREDGVTVFLSSHILSDIERVADHIGIVADGTLKVSEPLDQLQETVKRVRFHSFPGDPSALEIPGAFRTTRAKGEISATVRLADEAVLAETARCWHAQYEVENLNLEEIFVELSRA